MEITEDTVKYVAHLARIELQNKELETLSLQLKDILDFIDKLSRLETRNTGPSSHILTISNVLRDDLPGASLPPDKTLENAPWQQGNFFVVPKVLE